MLTIQRIGPSDSSPDRGEQRLARCARRPCRRRARRRRRSARRRWRRRRPAGARCPGRGTSRSSSCATHAGARRRARPPTIVSVTTPHARAHRFISRSIVGRYSGYVVGAPPNTRLERHTVELRVVLDERILARQVERHVVLVHRHFHDVLAVVEPVLIAALHEHELLAQDVRLREVHGVRDDHDVRQHVAVADVVLDERRQVAARDAAAAVELFLDVRRRDREDVAVPLARREAHVRVRHVRRRMRRGRPSRSCATACTCR